jgi:PIN domain nuclease of toxin-antitoxin system
VNSLLLDTNVVVWLLTGNRAAVSDHAVAALTDDAHPLLVSAASVWEIAIKRSLGKLRLADGWQAALRGLDVTPLPITSMHAEAVEDLPWHHRDPFDRLLVAQAMVEQCPLVTADTRLAAYSIDVVW